MVLEKAIFQYDDKEITLLPGKSAFEDLLFVEFLTEKSTGSHQRIKLNIHPKQPIIIKKLRLEFSHPYPEKCRIFCNGYQSWTESREYENTESIKPLRKLTARLFKPYGDYGFVDYPDLPGQLHSWSYTYITTGESETVFLGSLSEFTGFTLFRHNTDEYKLIIEKDCRGLHLDHSYPALDIFLGIGNQAELFNAYFKLLDLPPLKAGPAFGWTSWYNHYTNISEAIIIANLKAAEESALPVDIFQIDDGYQTKVGDWMNIKPAFPSGMAAIAGKIKASGMKAGLWVAPFICEKNSDVFKFKKHWLLKDENGQPVKAGYNPLWSGHFYALDFYNQEVRNHLNSTFFTILNQWGFDMVKLDFLYAAALQPPKNKTRGQAMHEAMQFLRKTVGEKLILGCGVPVSAAFGTTDYCRIGADVHLRWEHNLLKWLRNRERVSTHLAITNNIGRHQLNGRGFWNDPDVFILRKTKNKLSKTQQKTLLLVNVLFGDLIFTSDNFGGYNEETLDLLREMMKLRNRTDLKVEKKGLLYLCRFKLDGESKKAIFNLSGRKVKHTFGDAVIPLGPYESKVLDED